MKKSIMYTVIIIITSIAIQARGSNLSIATEIPVLKKITSTSDTETTPKRVTDTNNPTIFSMDCKRKWEHRKKNSCR